MSFFFFLIAQTSYFLFVKSTISALSLGETIIEGDSSDTASRTTSSMFSDEIGPVIGRREQRMKKSAMANPYRNSDSDYSDNDVQVSKADEKYKRIFIFNSSLTIKYDATLDADFGWSQS